MHGGDNKDKDDGECENRSSQEVNPIKKAVPKAGQRLWREGGVRGFGAHAWMEGSREGERERGIKNERTKGVGKSL